MFKPQMSMLAFEAQQVVWLRGIELARGGPAAKREAARMVNEKTAASRQAVLKGRIRYGTEGIVRGYQRKVRANARRLSR
ncbi:hypothetical protein AB6806_20460 [Bosea sp. RCC_152_1]|uniref:hypothetical protein n=1 Tax=Bosea sp. RCC_152_1 TaxID=3239228 RepID=UPI000DD948D9